MSAFSKVIHIIREIESDIGLRFVLEFDENEKKISLICDHPGYIMYEFLLRLLVRLFEDLLGIKLSCNGDCDA